jgi:hypothetical protein
MTYWEIAYFGMESQSSMVLESLITLLVGIAQEGLEQRELRPGKGRRRRRGGQGLGVSLGGAVFLLRHRLPIPVIPV